MMKSITVYESEIGSCVAFPDVEVTNEEAIVALGLCKNHGQEVEVMENIKFCKCCGVSVGYKDE